MNLSWIMTIAGPMLLGAVLLWAMAHNRTSKAEKQRTEEATRQLYREQNEADLAAERPKDTSS